MKIPRLALLLAAVLPAVAAAQQDAFTHADTLRGSITPERAWWDVVFYDLHVTLDPADSTVHGRNGITYRVTGPSRAMQIDLQVPLEIDSVVQDGRRLGFRRDGNAFFVSMASRQPRGALRTVTVYYHGRPRVAQKPPWDGGLIWARDPDGGSWISTACQGLGASVWWPNKDTQADEPDSQRVALTVPDSLQAVGNGRLRGIERGPDGWATWEWFVTSPINNYDVAPYVGRYAQYSDAYEGEGGHLTLDFWPLAAHLDAAREQWSQVKPMLQCFEHWFGPYPWYADGYQLVEAPHLGMEHQSAVAYGNGFRNGYKGYDLSGTGWGLQIDGQAVPNLDALRVSGSVGACTLPDDNIFGLVFDPGPHDCVADGYWALLPPLSVGQHTIHFSGGFSSPAFELDVTYEITVSAH